MFESIPDYRKKVLTKFLIKSDKNVLKEFGFLKSDNIRLNLECKNIFMEQNEEYIDHMKNEEESTIERIVNREVEAFFSNLFDDIRSERNLILLLALTDPDILKQSKFTDDEKKTIKNPALEKIHPQNYIKECFVLQLLE